MSTSLLYHAFGVRGYQQTSMKFADGCVRFFVQPSEKVVCCAACGSSDVLRRGFKDREFRAAPIGSKPTVIVATLPRVECRQCGTVRQIQVSFAEPRRSYTKGWARYALELSRSMTIKDVADQLNVSWDVIKELKKTHLKKHFATPSLKDVRQIAIDEICIGKGHRYLTLVMDLESGAIVFAGEGKSADSLAPFWGRLKRKRGQIEAVAMDMSAAYVSAVESHLPQASIVFDRFHVVKLMNDKLTQLRRQLFQEATLDQRSVLKGSRWLLLKNPENLDDKRDEQTRLQDALALNEPLATAYYLKEDLRQFWEQSFTFSAQLFLWSWCERATSTGLKPLATIAKTLLRLQDGLLNYFDNRISSGPMEGTNNKVKTIQRQSYGFRDHEYFKLVLYSLHQTKYALVG
jgi:transposase